MTRRRKTRFWKDELSFHSCFQTNPPLKIPISEPPRWRSKACFKKRIRLNPLIFKCLRAHPSSFRLLGILRANPIGMEKDNALKEAELQEALRKLETDLHQDLKRGHFYGLDLKIRHIQKTIQLSTRV